MINNEDLLISFRHARKQGHASGWPVNRPHVHAKPRSVLIGVKVPGERITELDVAVSGHCVECGREDTTEALARYDGHCEVCVWDARNEWEETKKAVSREISARR